MPRDRIELDLHRLELRFADSRLVEPRAVARLAESIERCGQIVPCIVVAAPGSQDSEGGGAQALVLIDGYRRVGALRRLGRDTVGVEQWSCDLTTALAAVLTRTLMARLRQRLPALLPLPEILRNAVPRLQAAMDALHHAINRSAAHDPIRDPLGHRLQRN